MIVRSHATTPQKPAEERHSSAASGDADDAIGKAVPERAADAPARGGPPRVAAPKRTAAWHWLPVFALLACAAVIAATGTNRQLFLDLNHWAASWPPALWSALSVLGSGVTLFPLFGWTLALRPRLVSALMLLLVIAASASYALKRLLDAPRPALVIPPEQINIIGGTLLHHSMPSGHALTTFAVAAVVLACRRRSTSWRALFAAALVLAVFGSLSRIAVGGHWPVDVLVGAAIGWSCGLLAVAWLRRLRAWRLAAIRRTMAAAVTGAAVALLFEQTGYPLAEPFKIAVALFGIALTAPIALAPRSIGRLARHAMERPSRPT